MTSPAGVAILLVVSVAFAIAGALLAERAPAATDSENTDLVRRVVRNSAIPIASQLLIRVVDLLVAIVLLRLLGPEGNGQYALAVIVWLYAKTISDFGLSLLTTREIARDRTSIARLVGMTTLFRWR